MDDWNASKQEKRNTGMGSGQSITLRGMLIPTEDGKLGGHRLSVLTDDEDEYVVDGEQYTQRLLKHLDDDVVIWGRVHTSSLGTKFISVAGYEVVAWDDESESGFDAGDYWT